jgi:hypothetical protein
LAQEGPTTATSTGGATEPASTDAAATTAAPAEPTNVNGLPEPNPQNASGDLANRRISVSGDMVSGMAGTETVYGPATVTTTNVVYGQGASKPIQQKLVQKNAVPEHQIDGVTYD